MEGPGLDDSDLLSRLDEAVDEGVRRRPGGAQDEPNDGRTDELYFITIILLFYYSIIRISRPHPTS